MSPVYRIPSRILRVLSGLSLGRLLLLYVFSCVSGLLLARMPGAVPAACLCLPLMRMGSVFWRCGELFLLLVLMDVLCPAPHTSHAQDKGGSRLLPDALRSRLYRGRKHCRCSCRPGACCSPQQGCASLPKTALTACFLQRPGGGVSVRCPGHNAAARGKERAAPYRGG